MNPGASCKQKPSHLSFSELFRNGRQISSRPLFCFDKIFFFWIEDFFLSSIPDSTASASAYWGWNPDNMLAAHLTKKSVGYRIIQTFSKTPEGENEAIFLTIIAWSNAGQ